MKHIELPVGIMIEEDLNKRYDFYFIDPKCVNGDRIIVCVKWNTDGKIGTRQVVDGWLGEPLLWYKVFQ